jgi:hypothetical protein
MKTDVFMMPLCIAMSKIVCYRAPWMGLTV